jgi:hypothetical protein
MRHPSSQFLSIRNLEREVIKADAPFVERAAQWYVMNLDRYHYAGRVDQVTVLTGFGTGAVNHGEPHNVVPPGGRTIAIRDRQFNMRGSLEFWHCSRSLWVGARNAARQGRQYLSEAMRLARLRIGRRERERPRDGKGRKIADLGVCGLRR